MRAVCRGTSVKAPGPGGFIEVPLHAALSLAQHDPTKSGSLSGHSAWWPESAWLTSFYNFRNPENNSLSGAEFCSLNERFSCGFGERSDDKQPTPKSHPTLTLDTNDSIKKTQQLPGLIKSLFHFPFKRRNIIRKAIGNINIR